MRKRKTNKKAASKAATFLDHTLMNGAILSTRVQHLDDKALLLEVGREYLSGMMTSGEHAGEVLPYTVRHDWPTVLGERMNFSGSVDMRPIFLWTVRKDGVDDHTALFIPPYKEPDWATEELRPYPEIILASVILLSMDTSPLPRTVEPETEEITGLARAIAAQRPLLTTVPLVPMRMVGGEPTIAMDLLGREYDEHHARMATLSISIASAVMTELFAITTHIYVPYPDVNVGVVKATFTTDEFTQFHREHTVPVVAEDDPGSPIDIERSAAVGALKLQEVLVDGKPCLLWVVQPGYYSEEFGLELPE